MKRLLISVLIGLVACFVVSATLVEFLVPPVPSMTAWHTSVAALSIWLTPATGRPTNYSPPHRARWVPTQQRLHAQQSAESGYRNYDAASQPNAELVNTMLDAAIDKVAASGDARCVIVGRLAYRL